MTFNIQQRSYTLRTGAFLRYVERSGSLDEVSHLAIRETFVPAMGPGIVDTCLIGIDLVWHEPGRNPFPLDDDRVRAYIVSCSRPNNALNRAKLSRQTRQDAQELADLIGVPAHVDNEKA